MGIMNELCSFLGISKRETKILVIGLDNSGKTTILNYLKPPEAQSTQVVPTVGFSIESFTSNNMSFTAMDMSGQSRYRSLWESHARDVQGIIFVVDSSDHLRMAVAKDELWVFLEYKDIASKRIPLLVFANKMDEKGALDTFDVNVQLGLNLIRTRNWNICGSCALTGDGITEGLKWLAESIRSYVDGKS
uniref:ADP-ribosylation factor-like protein 6 n=1 Tax=Syphacia muris TaxID=451379 RepID=A0A0N5AW95_9BILA